MAKRKSNREAARALGLTHYHSNTRIMTMRGDLVQVKPSRRQRRNDKRRFEWLREHASTDCDYSGIADHNPQFHH